jgi:hypothetical protein
VARGNDAIPPGNNGATVGVLLRCKRKGVDEENEYDGGLASHAALGIGWSGKMLRS